MSRTKGTLFTLARATALAGLSITPCSAIAQDEATDAEQDEVYELAPLTVSARRFETDASQIASSIMQVDASGISARAATNMADLLGELGVNLRSFTGNPTQSTIDMRGYGESGNLNTLVLIDGRRVNAPDMSGINWLNMPLVSVERVEVLRGSQSAFYGNNAGGGVIDITTSIPEGTGTAAMLCYGSWETITARAAAWMPLGETVRSSTEVGFLESDGYRDNSAYKTRSVSQSLQGKAGTIDWKASAGYDDNWFLFPGPLDNESYEEDPRQSGYYPMGADYYAESENYYASGAADWKGDALELHADLNWNHVQNPWNMGVGLGAERELDTWKFAPRARYILSDSLAFIVGADGEYDDLTLGVFDDLAHTQRRSHATLKRSTGGLYGNASLKSGKDGTLAIDFTARAQAHKLRDRSVDDSGKDPVETESKSGSDSAFSLGASWQATKNLRLWARGDRFFRYPAIDEIVAYQGYDLLVPFNSQLDSEYGWSGEAGVDFTIPHAMFRLNGFAQDVKNLIVFDYTHNLNVNLAQARRLGLEASAQFAYGQFKGGVFYTLLDVKLTDGHYDYTIGGTRISGNYTGKDLYLVPRHQVSGNLQWTPGRFSLRLSGRYTGEQWQGNDFANKMDKMPSYFVMDVVARYRFSENITVFAGLDNALDKKYSALRYSGVWYPAAERSYRCGVQLRY